MIQAFLNHYKWLIIPGIIVVGSVIAIIMLLVKPTDPGRLPSSEDIYPTTIPMESLPPQQKKSPIQKTTIGQTTEDEIERLPDFLEKETISDGSTRFFFSSPLNSRPEVIITKNGKAIYESVLVPENPNTAGYVKAEEYKNQYGEPEAMLQGSTYYGWHMQVYVYGPQGFALIVNPYTDEVFEIHVFQPMSTDDYIKYYGDDISPNSDPPLESE